MYNVLLLAHGRAKLQSRQSGLLPARLYGDVLMESSPKIPKPNRGILKSRCVQISNCFMGKLRYREFSDLLSSHTHQIKDWRSFQGACLPVGTAASHKWGLCVTVTSVAWPEPGTTVEALILAVSSSTSLLGLSLSILICHMKGDRSSSLWRSISSLKFYSHHSQEGYSILESATLDFSEMQSTCTGTPEMTLAHLPPPGTC